MGSAEKNAAMIAYIGYVVLYAIFLFITVLIVSFFLGLIRSMSCTTGPRNTYEHFQDANTINKHLLDSIISMSSTITEIQNNIQESINNTTSMKVQACSGFDELHNKYIQSYAKEATNAAEFKLSQAEQDRLAANRAKNGEDMWAQEIGAFQFFRKKTMLNCALVDVSGVSVGDMREGFQDGSLETLAQTLEQKTFMFNTYISKPAIVNWLSDCGGLSGTSDFVSRYVHNTKIKNEIGKCVSDLQKSVGDFKTRDPEDQGKLMEIFNEACHKKYDPQLEPFQNYVNTQFTFPVPFPTSSLSQDQIRYYTILSRAHDAINHFNTLVGRKYKDANTSFTRMNQTQQIYRDYMNQINSVQNNLNSDTTKTLS